MHTLTINHQPFTRKAIIDHMAPFFSWDKPYREYNRRFRTNVTRIAQNIHETKTPNVHQKLDVIGEHGRYEDFFTICNQVYPREVI